MNAKNNYGITALMIAAIHNISEIAKLVIDSGADLNIQDNKGQTALMIVNPLTNRSEIVKLIKSRIEYLDKVKKEVSNYFSDPNAQIFTKDLSNIINNYLN